MRKSVLGVSDTNPAVKAQRMAIDLKFWISEEASWYYLCNENKGADQLRGLHLGFGICKKQVFS